MSYTKEKFSPVVLFVYNRPIHTKKVIDALLNNAECVNTDLYIFSDSAKTLKDEEGVIEVRKLIHQVAGFKKVEIVERNENYGLARNIIEGVTNIIDEYGKVIVLEDDIIVSRFFLKYMNDALEMYESEKQVMAISGYCEVKDSKKKCLPHTFFLPWFDCWGWATWKDAWSHFEKDPKKLIETVSEKEKKRININGTGPRWNQVEANYSGDLNTWAIFFFVQIVLNDGLVLYSNRNVCHNIGNDGTGTDYGMTSLYLGEVLSDEPIDVQKCKLEFDKKGEKLVENFYRVLPYKLFVERVIRKIRKTIVTCFWRNR